MGDLKISYFCITIIHNRNDWIEIRWEAIGPLGRFTGGGVMVSKTTGTVESTTTGVIGQKRKRGRPRKIDGESKTLTVRLSLEELNKLDADAKSRGLKRSEWLRALINGLDRTPESTSL